jgi:hypothetical protein
MHDSTTLGKIGVLFPTNADVFQEKISTLMSGLEFVRAYIDDLLFITQSTWKHHLLFRV